MSELSERSRKVETTSKFLKYLGEKAVEQAFGAAQVGLAVAAIATVGSFYRNENQNPYFSARKVSDCLVSTEWQWVPGNIGINGLAIRYVEGIKADGGKGSECLEAAKIVISEWANQDDYPLNDIDLSEINPIIRTDQHYAIPLFAHKT